MDRAVFKYLLSYNTDPITIDRLIVSAFLVSNKITVVQNKLIRKLIITEADADQKMLQEFLNMVGKLDFEDLIDLFEFVISPPEKIVNGAVYTPRYIREYIVKEAFDKAKTIGPNIKIADIACGCSGFLLTAAELMKERTDRSFHEIFEENLYGLDIEQYSIDRSEILLSLLGIVNGEDRERFVFNFHQGDALEFNWQEQVDIEGFDIIVGNPPYVCSRNMEKRTRRLLKNWSVSTTGHPDLYIPFFQIGLENLKDGGILGYITVNTFFKSINGRALRGYFESKRLGLEIIDFGGELIFQSKATYTCLCFIKNSECEVIEYVASSSKELGRKLPFISIPWKKLDAHNGWNLKEIEFIEKIENTGSPFKNIYRATSGIATLLNHVYIFDPIHEDDQYFYLKNGSEFAVEKEICIDVVNSNKFTKIDNIEAVRRKLIFPYIYDNETGRPDILDEGHFMALFPQTYKYLYHKKEDLKHRDKGNGHYEKWYAFGRRQSLERFKYKLFYPHISKNSPHFVLSNDEDLLFYNGKAVVSNNENKLRILQKIFSSALFWKYILLSSKPYSSGYYSLGNLYLKNFGIPSLNPQEEIILLGLDTGLDLDYFVEGLYDKYSSSRAITPTLF